MDIENAMIELCMTHTRDLQAFITSHRNYQVDLFVSMHYDRNEHISVFMTH